MAASGSYSSAGMSSYRCQGEPAVQGDAGGGAAGGLHSIHWSGKQRAATLPQQCAVCGAAGGSPQLHEAHGVNGPALT